MRLPAGGPKSSGRKHHAEHHDEAQPTRSNTEQKREDEHKTWSRAKAFGASHPHFRPTAIPPQGQIQPGPGKISRSSKGDDKTCAHCPARSGDVAQSSAATSDPVAASPSTAPAAEATSTANGEVVSSAASPASSAPAPAGEAEIKTAASLTVSSLLSATSSDDAAASGTHPKFDSGSTPPACPGANATVFRDASQIEYTIHCGTDNTATSNGKVSIVTGGYGSCFSACSSTAGCAGFTFVGSDSGNCYLKATLPKSDFVENSGSTYVTCNKVHPDAFAPPAAPSNTTTPNPPTASATPSSSKKAPIGAIVGGVIGGVLLIGLILIIIALLAKRKRKQIEQRRDDPIVITHLPQDPIEMTTSPAQNSYDAHQRSLSTFNDVFQPLGGGYRESNMGELPIWNQTSRGFGTAAPAGVRPMTMFYPQPMAEGTPVSTSASSSSGPRSPRFTEHLAEPGGPPAPNTLAGPGGISSAASSPSTAANSARQYQHRLSPSSSYGQTSLRTKLRDENRMPSSYLPKSSPSARSGNSVSPSSRYGQQDGGYFSV
ncbi:hypothetical protein BDY17DRAFT_183160 [Neohortaea acidophila]|uniref:Apple domain-containing protein n=1 Tax=Neohortaea acidophila TaxID=245834 RepID=A0A6A6PM59_9PEZI|nr:uncharacterized protein BDY17DRAFT_183160 [Neohortaea acidophila]KAF2481129.1 hypothetical protein BDY17DRAFT_183160 [Neohortaea acidophila]